MQRAKVVECIVIDSDEESETTSLLSPNNRKDSVRFHVESIKRPLEAIELQDQGDGDLEQILSGLSNLQDPDSSFLPMLRKLYSQDKTSKFLLDFERGILGDEKEGEKRDERVIKLSASLFKYENCKDIILLVEESVSEVVSNSSWPSIALVYIAHCALAYIVASKRKSQKPSTPNYEFVAAAIVQDLIKERNIESELLALGFIELESILLMDYYSGKETGVQVILNNISTLSLTNRKFFQCLSNALLKIQAINSNDMLQAVGKCWVAILGCQREDLFRPWFEAFMPEQIKLFLFWCLEHVTRNENVRFEWSGEPWEARRIYFDWVLLFELPRLFQSHVYQGCFSPVNSESEPFQAFLSTFQSKLYDTAGRENAKRAENSLKPILLNIVPANMKRRLSDSTVLLSKSIRMRTNQYDKVLETIVNQFRSAQEATEEFLSIPFDFE